MKAPDRKKKKKFDDVLRIPSINNMAAGASATGLNPTQGKTTGRSSRPLIHGHCCPHGGLVIASLAAGSGTTTSGPRQRSGPGSRRAASGLPSGTRARGFVRRWLLDKIARRRLAALPGPLMKSPPARARPEAPGRPRGETSGNRCPRSRRTVRRSLAHGWRFRFLTSRRIVKREREHRSRQGSSLRIRRTRLVLIVPPASRPVFRLSPTTRNSLSTRPQHSWRTSSSTW